MRAITFISRVCKPEKLFFLHPGSQRLQREKSASSHAHSYRAYVAHGDRLALAFIQDATINLKVLISQNKHSLNF